MNFTVFCTLKLTWSVKYLYAILLPQLGTDYTSYVTVYSCKDLLLARSQSAWILTRERQPSDETVRTKALATHFLWSFEELPAQSTLK